MSTEHTPESIVPNVRRRMIGRTNLRRTDVRNMVRHAMVYARMKIDEDKVNQLTDEVLSEPEDGDQQAADETPN